MGTLVGVSVPAQASAPEKQLTYAVDKSLCDPGETGWCESYNFRIDMKSLFGDDGVKGVYDARADVTYKLHNSRGSVADEG